MASSETELEAALSSLVCKLSKINPVEELDEKLLSEQQLHFAVAQRFKEPVLFRQVTSIPIKVDSDKVLDARVQACAQYNADLLEKMELHQACEAAINDLSNVTTDEESLNGWGRQVADQTGIDLKKALKKSLGMA